jgi:hypothetical protein
LQLPVEQESEAGRVMKIKYLLLTVFFTNFAFISDVVFTNGARAATFTVNNAGDNGAGSLRDSIAAAASGDTITFGTALSGQTITLTNGQLTLANDLTIDASSLPDGATISGNASNRIFEVSSAAIVALKSLTLRDGVAPDANYPTNSGGAILNYGTLTLNACSLQGNHALQGIDPSGGGVENYLGTLTVSNCAFLDNSAQWGGAIENDFLGGSLLVYHSTFSSNFANSYDGGGIENYEAAAAVADTSFADNSAGRYGGGVANYNGMLTVSNCAFLDNSAQWGGAIENDFGGSLTVYNSAFSTNSATIYIGGGIDNYEGAATVADSTLAGNFGKGAAGGIENYYGMLTVSNCVFSNNSGGYGGAIENDYDSLTVYRSTFSGNFANSNDGGGIENYGGTVTATDCTFADNSASGGGGIENYHGTLTVGNCTYSGNSAHESGAIDNYYAALLKAYNSTFFSNTAATNGGSMCIRVNSTATVNNCTFSANSAFYNGGGIWNDSTNSLFLTNTIVARNTALNGTNISGSFSGANNLTSGDPMLASLGNYGGLTPTMPPLTGSPAIDAGDDSVTSFLAMDQRGYPRKSGTHVDIGAVELQGVIAANPPLLMPPVAQAGGSVMFDFTNNPDAEFIVLASTNLALPMSQWNGLGLATQSSPGQYQFTDSDATNYPHRFYRVVSP